MEGLKPQRVLLIGAFSGVVSGIIATVNPSLPTSIWMWRERPEYRIYQLSALGLTLFALAVIVYVALRD